MGGVLKWFLEVMAGWIEALANGDSMLVANIDGWSGSLFNTLVAAMNAVVLPVAYTVLVLFMLLELISVAQKAEHSGHSLPTDIIFKVILKFILCKIAVDSSLLIMTGIYQLTTSLTVNMGAFLSGGTAGGADISEMLTAADDLSFWSALGALIPTVLALLITGAAVLIAKIIVTVRFVEIYVYLAISPVPVATFAGEEISSVGKNFLKSFAAVCIQGFLIYLVLAFIPIVLNTSLFNLSNASGVGSFLGSVFGLIGYSIVLLIAVFSCKGWAKSICNAM